jgi:6-phosphogluconolactonase
MYKTSLRYFPDSLSMSDAASEYIAALLKNAVDRRGIASFVLAGGKTPQSTYRMLSKKEVDWSRVHFFWGDERWLPGDHPDSNYHMARQTLLDHIPRIAANIHPMVKKMDSLKKAADAYDAEVTAFFKNSGSGRGKDPVSADRCFDVTLLGMGNDGHTASLFPGHPLLHEKSRLVGAVNEPQGSPQVPRITMTVTALSRSHSVLFLISGARKRKILEKIMASEPKERFPAAHISAFEEVCWYVSETP